MRWYPKDYYQEGFFKQELTRIWTSLDFYLLKLDGELSSCATFYETQNITTGNQSVSGLAQDCRVDELLRNFERRAEAFRGPNKKISFAQLIEKGLYYHISKVFFWL